MNPPAELAWLNDFLVKLRCPSTHEPLRVATPEEKQPFGAAPDTPALINQSGTHLYPVIDGIPHLLPGSAVMLP